MDTRSSCPSVFKKNNLAILPVEDRKYVIFLDPQLKSYFTFSPFYESIEPEEYEPSRYIATLETIQQGKIDSIQIYVKR